MTYYVTYSGKKIIPEQLVAGNIPPELICLEDIAHNLSSYKCCRYGGSLPSDMHYSVANHSMVLAKYAKDKGYSIRLQKYLLMHDATEAILGDVISDLKRIMPAFNTAESGLWEVIKTKYNIEVFCYQEKIAKHLDTAIRLDEVKSLMPWNYLHFESQMPDHKPLDVKVVPDVRPSRTERNFLKMCEQLGIKD